MPLVMINILLSVVVERTKAAARKASLIRYKPLLNTKRVFGKK